MKRIIAIGIIALFVSGIYSCTRKDDTDLTAAIVGTYCGQLKDNGSFSAGCTVDTTAYNFEIQITRIDNSTIQVQPISSGYAPAYTAQLNATSSGYNFVILPGTFMESYSCAVTRAQGGCANDPKDSSLVPNLNSYEPNDALNVFVSATNTLQTSLRLASGGYIDFETYQGTKCTAQGK